MTDEHMSEFDYALPWWRRIVAHSEYLRRTEMLIQIKQETLLKLQDVTQRIHGRFVASPIWPLIRDEPIIKEYIEVLRELESECKPKMCDLCARPEHLGPCYEKPKEEIKL